MRRAILPIAFLVLAVLFGLLARQAGEGQAAATGATRPGAVTPVLSVRRIPEWLASPQADARLRSSLDQIVAASPAATCLTVTARGRLIYQHGSDQLLQPASTEKLVTAAAALAVLGPSARFHTNVVAPVAMVDGVVRSDAFLVGGGDPLLSTGDYADHFEEQPQITTSLETLADRLVRSGLKEISGRLLGDESRYDQVRTVPSWPPRFATQNESGPLSALTVNDNFTSFPSLQPEATATMGTPAPDPPTFAAQTLADLLRARGVRVSGYGAGVAPKGARLLGRVDSPPLASIVKELLTGSDNQTAELLTKEMGRVRGGGGTTAAGVRVIRSAALRLGLPVGATTLTDGSGLDEGNHLTCAFLARLLDRTGPRSPVAAGLPVAGKTGTLRARFLMNPAKDRLRAKTGTLNNVTALAGYVDTVPGATLTFSYIATGRAVTAELLGVQEALGAALVRYPEGPPLLALGPSAR